MVNREDLRREAEVYKYFNTPKEFSEGGEFLGANISRRTSLLGSFDDGKPPTSTNQTLTALAQLCAVRLNAGRAMISVIDSTTQYFIAEATKTLNLKNTTKSDSISDGLWLGCTSVAKDGRLCEKTIELRPSPGRYACFTVTDLSKDDRFKNLPFVKGPPFFRFYAGTPLTTKSGVNIGSLFVIDENNRPELSEPDVEMFGTLAGIVMKNLDLAYEAEIKQKFIAMKDGINAFQSGRDHIKDNSDEDPLCRPIEETEESESDTDTKLQPRRRGTQDTSDRALQWADTRHEPILKRSKPVASGPNDISSRTPTRGPSPHPSSEVATSPKPSSKRTVFSRAANLMRQSLGLEMDGGVCFLDASTGFTPQSKASAFLFEDEDEGAMARKRVDSSDVKGGSVTLENDGFNRSLPSRINGDKKASVLAYSTTEKDFGLGSEVDGVESFRPLPEKFLQYLIQSYPRGKLWLFTEMGPLSSSDDENASNSIQISEHKKMANPSKRIREAQILQSHFPRARQLLFAPLWDPIVARWHNGCFCFSTKLRPVMSMEAELSFTLTFGSCVMAEHSRLESVAADMQKSDFIGSISHELRSPLHGVLASAEFLSETSSDPFQSSLINTVSSCGRTLLDTINHILDYSKINKFERSWVNARNSRARKSTLAMNNRAASNTTQSAEAPPLMNIYSTTDLAIAAEEVVEGVYAGQIYQDISSVDIMHKSADSSIEPLDHQRIPRGAVSRLNSPSAVKNVEVILDIAPGDYVFTTQIGAVRRVIMNVFGNALKYTNKGLIVVKLSLSDLEGVEEMQCANEKLLTISIKDTGKGIASKYLKDSLYKPFSQEDVLATGVGLGLSIVKSIVTMLNGSIDINSQVGVGTQVVLRIPLLRLPGVGTSTSTPSTVTSSARSGGPNPVITMLSEHPNRCISLYGFSFETQPEDVERHRVLEHYVIQWFHYRIAEVDSTEYDIIVVDEQNMQRLCSEIEVRRPIVILCGSSPPKLSEHARKQELVIEIVSKPFGPYKLAKALQACLSRLSERAKSSSTAMPGANPSISESSSASTETPQLGRLTLDIDDDPMELSQMGSTTARDTANANMAINSPSTFSGVGSSAETEISGSAFPPMPHEVTAGDRFRVALLSRPRLDKRVTEPVFSRFASPSHSDPQGMAQSPIAHSTPKPGSEITSPTPSSLADIREERKASSSETSEKLKSQEKSRSPRLLLVEDNKINLRLLQTYMRKRKYRLVDSAENGQFAVHAAKAKSETYDIIFMDISMPIMNGFEATRAIREIEDDRRREKEKNGSKERMRPALIIALTGLASARDQSEAFASGVDLFMTKPVSFKEVGQLLDNWEANEKIQQEMERTAEDLGLRSDASKIAIEDGR